MKRFLLLLSSLTTFMAFSSFNPDTDDVYLNTPTGRKNYYEVLKIKQKINTKAEKDAQKSLIENKCNTTSDKNITRACDILGNESEKEKYDLRLSVIQKQEAEISKPIKQGTFTETTPKATGQFKWNLEIKYNLKQRSYLQIVVGGVVIVKDYLLNPVGKDPLYLRIANIDTTQEVEVYLSNTLDSRSYIAHFSLTPVGKNVFVKIGNDKNNVITLDPQEGVLFRTTSGLSTINNIGKKQIKSN